mgnify:CR=1 FL=1
MTTNGSVVGPDPLALFLQHQQPNNHQRHTHPRFNGLGNTDDIATPRVAEPNVAAASPNSSLSPPPPSPPRKASDIPMLHRVSPAPPLGKGPTSAGKLARDNTGATAMRISPRDAMHSLMSIPRTSSSGFVAALFYATATGDLAQVRALLASGMCSASAHEQSARDTALHVLCRSSNSAAVSVPMLESLLHHKADPMARNHLGSVPLHNVHPTADATLVRSLASLTRLSVRDNGGWTPLHCAAASGHLTVVRALIECDAEIDALGGNGLTPLHVAICNARIEVVELLLSVHADANRITASNALTGVHLAAVAAQDSGSVSMLCVLAKAHVDFTAIDSLGQTALHVLARTPSLVLPPALLPYLLRLKCPALARDFAGLSALELAVRRDNLLFAAQLVRALQLQIGIPLETADATLGFEHRHRDHHHSVTSSSSSSTEAETSPSSLLPPPSAASDLAERDFK